jgi:hypothetical protein
LSVTTAWPDALCLRYYGCRFLSFGIFDSSHFGAENGSYRFDEMGKVGAETQVTTLTNDKTPENTGR